MRREEEEGIKKLKEVRENIEDYEGNIQKGRMKELVGKRVN